MKKLLFFFTGLMILFCPRGLWPQTSAIPWSSFSGGFGVSTSANTTVYSSAGEIAGAAEGGNTIIKSGFLVVGLPPDFTTAIEISEGLPTTYTLSQNYPNPFNPATTLRFALPQATTVRLAVYDLQGREVARLLDGAWPAGYHYVVWDGRNAGGQETPSGIYIGRMVTPEYTQSIKMVLLK